MSTYPPTLLPQSAFQTNSMSQLYFFCFDFMFIFFHHHQTKWQDNRMSTKQVTITVTQSIHQVDKNGKVKKSLTTYEVMKPAESLIQVTARNT